MGSDVSSQTGTKGSCIFMDSGVGGGTWRRKIWGGKVLNTESEWKKSVFTVSCAEMSEEGFSGRPWTKKPVEVPWDSNADTQRAKLGSAQVPSKASMPCCALSLVWGGWFYLVGLARLKAFIIACN